MNRTRLSTIGWLGILFGSHMVAVDSDTADAASPSAVSQQDEQLLLGFESVEIAAFPAALKQKVVDTTDVEGRPCRELQMIWASEQPNPETTFLLTRLGRKT